MSSKNELEQVRPTSRFETYRTFEESQEIAKDVLARLAALLLSQAERMLGEKYPFDHGALYVFSGGPGRGKTHLVEAFVNHLSESEPRLLKRIYLERYDFTLANIAGVHSYNECPIIIIDDMFAKYPSIDQLHDGTDLSILMRFIHQAYEMRQLVLITSNFPFLDGLVSRIQKIDRVGRSTSRVKELLSRSGEFVISGPDYREFLSKNRGPSVHTLLPQR